MRLKGEMIRGALNDGQLDVFNIIMEAIDLSSSSMDHHHLLFLDGTGVTGKTFVYKTLISVIKGRGNKVIVVAPTGIASTLLIYGSTYHSQFKLCPSVTDDTQSRIEEHHFEAKKIRDAIFIICDDATTMIHHGLKAIEKLFMKVTMKPNVLFVDTSSFFAVTLDSYTCTWEKHH